MNYFYDSESQTLISRSFEQAPGESFEAITLEEFNDQVLSRSIEPDPKEEVKR